MTDGGGSVIVGAAQALSRPVEKLIEVVSAGLGKVYEPIHIRRAAKAEGARLVTMAESEVAVSDLQRRAAQRWLAVETARQENIEAIADQAAEALAQNPTVDDRPVAPDWSARFFDECKDVSDEEMRKAWAKVLAGEVAQPGSYSVRTLRVLSGLSPKEASTFEKVCRMVYYGLGGMCSPYFVREDEDALRDAGVGFGERARLVAAGLLQEHETGLSALKVAQVFVLTPPCESRLILVDNRHSTKTQIHIGKVALTPAGQELATLWSGQHDGVHEARVVRLLQRQGLRTETIERDADGSFPTPAWYDEWWQSESAKRNAERVSGHGSEGEAPPPTDAA